MERWEPKSSSAQRRRKLVESAAESQGGVVNRPQLYGLGIARRQLCAGRRYPEPTRQAVRHTASGRRFFDSVWQPYDVSVEIHGIRLDLETWMADMDKQNAATLDGHRVLQIPNVALHVDADRFLDQLGEALRAGGWPGPDG